MEGNFSFQERSALFLLNTIDQALFNLKFEITAFSVVKMLTQIFGICSAFFFINLDY